MLGVDASLHQMNKTIRRQLVSHQCQRVDLHGFEVFKAIGLTIVGQEALVIESSLTWRGGPDPAFEIDGINGFMRNSQHEFYSSKWNFIVEVLSRRLVWSRRCIRV